MELDENGNIILRLREDSPYYKIKELESENKILRDALEKSRKLLKRAWKFSRPQQRRMTEAEMVFLGKTLKEALEKTRMEI